MRTDDIANSISALCGENDMTERQLLGYLLHRFEYHSGSKQLAQFGLQLMNNEDPLQKKSFDVLDAITLQHDLNLTKEQMRNLQRYIIFKHILLNKCYPT